MNIQEEEFEVWTVHPVTEWVKGRIEARLVETRNLRGLLDPVSMDMEGFMKKNLEMKTMEAGYTIFLEMLSKHGQEELIEPTIEEIANE